MLRGPSLTVGVPLGTVTGGLRYWYAAENLDRPGGLSHWLTGCKLLILHVVTGIPAPVKRK
jgi:hypothetical protein